MWHIELPQFVRFNASQKYLKFGNEDEIGKTMSPAKAQRRQGSENSKNLFNFAPWRLGGINFPGVVLFNISKVSIYSDLCGLGVFARDIPSFGCGSASLGRCREKEFGYLTAEALVVRKNSRSPFDGLRTNG